MKLSRKKILIVLSVAVVLFGAGFIESIIQNEPKIKVSKDVIVESIESQDNLIIVDDVIISLTENIPKVDEYETLGSPLPYEVLEKKMTHLIIDDDFFKSVQGVPDTIEIFTDGESLHSDPPINFYPFKFQTVNGSEYRGGVTERQWGDSLKIRYYELSDK